ncbi:transglycosylase SLT domain-containing protein [Segnochrobactraceae bacterium EtOH-i3]
MVTRMARAARHGRILLATCVVAGLVPVSGLGLAQEMQVARADSVSPQGGASLKAAADAVSAGRIAEAIRIRNGLGNSLDGKIIDWMLIRTGEPTLSVDMITGFYRSSPGWPTPKMLRRRAEEALYRSNESPQAIISAFGRSQPESVKGTIILARSLIAVGKRSEAVPYVRESWRTDRMEAAEEQAFYSEFSAMLTKEDHRFRADKMLYDDRQVEAARMKRYLSASDQTYVDARLAVIRKAPDAMARINALSVRDPGVRYGKIVLLRRDGQDEAAAELLLGAPTKREQLVDPDAWWTERRVISRELLDLGDAKTAYKIVAAHAAESPSVQADAEFHAGWYALSYLKDPRRAAAHFQRIEEVSSTPISKARAEYWMGRADEAAGSTGSAKTHYQKAAQYGMTYYGQLARARLGHANTAVGGAPRPSGADKAAFDSNEMVRVIKRLNAVGLGNSTWPFFDQLSDTLPTPGQVALLSQLAEQMGKNHFALNVAKSAMQRGLPVQGLAFPTAAIPRSAQMPAGFERPLVYAIARQESTFNPGAVSPAGARGLMQLMPATASATAKKVGVPFQVNRLTADPAYNATLGAAHLDELIGRFDGSYIMTFAAYNAGSSRVNKWVQMYGDPRDPRVDAVDWVERIPYAETRNYVQRVMENLQVYREQLGSGKLAIDKDLKRGTPGVGVSSAKGG